MDWQTAHQANEQTTSKMNPSLVKTENLCMDNRKNTSSLNSSSPLSCILYLSVCAVHPEIHVFSVTPPPLMSPQSTFSAACPYRASGEEFSVECYWCMRIAMGKCSLWNTHNTYCISACIQMHNPTQHHSNTLLYICTVCPLCIVSDAVLCMLTCRWNVTTFHRGGCAGRQWINSLNQCKPFVSFTSVYFDLRKCTLTWQKRFYVSRSYCERLSSTKQRCWCGVNS